MSIIEIFAKRGTEFPCLGRSLQSSFPADSGNKPNFTADVGRIFAALAVLLALATSTHASPRAKASPPGPFRPLPEDRGGDLPIYINAIAAANKSRTLVVIEGVCVSACTIKLAAKNRCVKADAMLWFHSATEGSVASAIGNKVLIDSYPPRVRDEVRRRHMLDDVALDPEHTLTGRELIALGERECRVGPDSLRSRRDSAFVRQHSESSR